MINSSQPKFETAFGYRIETVTHNSGPLTWCCGYIYLPANHPWAYLTNGEIEELADFQYEISYREHISESMETCIGFDTCHPDSEEWTQNDVRKALVKIANIARESEYTEGALIKAARAQTRKNRELIDKLREAREANGITVEQVANKMSVHPQWVTGFEAHNFNPTLQTLARYAVAIGAEINYDVKA